MSTTPTVQFDFLDDTFVPPAATVQRFARTSVSVPRCADPAAVPASTPSCEVHLDRDRAALWVQIKRDCAPKFTPALLQDLRELQERIATYGRARVGTPEALRYQVFASSIPGVYSLGGDLALFRDCIRRQDAVTLRHYARDAVDLVHANATGHGLPLTTISLVRGQALGGGFEAALAGHVLIAERGSRMGLPEVLFNMFPGMGAFQLLCRRVSPAEAERMILGGRTYTAEELHALGVVDILADEGEGELAVHRYIQTHDRQQHARMGFRRAREAATPLDLNELYRMVEVWVETALGLGERDLDTIDYLLRAQDRMAARSALASTPPELLKEA